MMILIAAALAAAQPMPAPAANPAGPHAQHQQQGPHQGHQQHGDMAKMMEHCKEMMKKMHSEQEKHGAQDHQKHGGR